MVPIYVYRDSTRLSKRRWSRHFKNDCSLDDFQNAGAARSMAYTTASNQHTCTRTWGGELNQEK